MKLNLLKYDFMTSMNAIFMFFKNHRKRENDYVKTELIGEVYGRVERIINASHQEASKAVVITPTTGSPHLYKAIESVQKQSFQDIIHVIVVDGAEFEENVRCIAEKFNCERCQIITLPFNTGRNGMNGHRIYASFPLLANSEYVFFLDEDNWWDVDHVTSLIDLIEKKDLDWAYAMRKVYTHNEEFVAEDNCESIGLYTPFSRWPNLVDTNCYALKRSTIVKTAHHWYHPSGADRYFYNQLIQKFPNSMSSRKYTVNYRLKEGKPLFPEDFLAGNQYMLSKYNNKLPWV